MENRSEFARVLDLIGEHRRQSRQQQEQTAQINRMFSKPVPRYLSRSESMAFLNYGIRKEDICLN